MAENKSEFRTTRGYALQNSLADLTSSMEDYLEMIYRLSKEKGSVKVSMVSEQLHVKPSSVSKMNRKLSEMELILVSPGEGILLTDAGKEKAEYLLYRHDVLEKFLTLIGSQNPLFETELLEHTLLPETVHKINELTEFLTSPEIQPAYRKV